jgi:riboflavin synthase
MFTGIIESIGFVKEKIVTGSNTIFWIESQLSSELKVDQSLAHDGVCLTIEEIKNGSYKVTAVEETLHKTNLHNWNKGSVVNLERSLLLSSRLDGHFVQGHVDCTAICKRITDKKGSWELTFTFPKKFSNFIIEKGSISINGVSLTVFDVQNKTFSVAIIPYTFDHTTMKHLKIGEEVNIEFDMIGKYIVRNLGLKAT